ncbi:MAG: hypothetical protein ACJAU2_001636 [Maribacter sp.]|jgi:hypothetical protein
MKLKHVITLIVITCLGAIIYGYTLGNEENGTAEKFIGSGTLGIFLVAMPLFLYKESKHRKWEDYMLNDQNVRKMQGKPPKDTDNQ